MAATEAAGGPLAVLAAAAESVRRRIRDGFVPQVHLRNVQRWVRIDGQRVVEAPITPPEGMILDELVLLHTDEQHGTLHYHRLWGKLRRHRHRDGHRDHSHVVGGPAAQEGDIIHP